MTITDHIALKLLVALALVCHVRGDCVLTRSQVEKTNGILTYRDAQQNLQLQFLQKVPNGVTLELYCPTSPTRQITCQTNNRFQPQLPLSCAQPAQASVRLVTDQTCPYMYAVGYSINNQFLEIYRSCYDRNNVRAHYTEATLYPKSFFPQRAGTSFTGDGLITPRDEASFTRRNIYKAFQRIYGKTQSYIPNDQEIIINRGHLTASADFLFNDQSSATFKYLNVVPQFESINDGNWKTIEKWVRSQIPANSVFQVRTGAVGIFTAPDTSPSQIQKPAYLAGGTKNPIPEWTYKVVKSATNQPLYVFLTYNNIYAGSKPRVPLFCSEVQCPIALIETETAGFTYCCDPNNFSV